MDKRKFLTRYEVDAILKEARKSRYAERNYCMILMCYLHGFRVSELCHLSLSDIDLDSRLIYVRRLKGGAISRQQVHTLLKQYGRAANISVAPHPHMLRHACGYSLADLGRDTRLIQDYLGHRNISHTVIYTASNSKRFQQIWDPLRG